MTIYRDYMTGDRLVGLHVAYASAMAKQMRIETPILSYLSPTLMNLHTKGGMVPFGQRAYKYKEKQYLHARTTLNGDVAEAATTVVLTDKIARPGDLIVVNDEVITLGDSDDYLTFTGCTRSTFTGADHALTSGDQVFLFGTSYAEQQNAPTAGPIKQATEVTTHTDIFMDSVKVSGSAQAMQQYAEGNMDKVVEYTLDVTIGLKHQLQYRMIWSDYQAGAGETTAGRMDGAYERVVGSNYIDFSDADITYPDIQKMVRKINRKGNSGQKVLFVSDYQGHQIDQWLQAYGRIDSSQWAQTVFGTHVPAVRVGNEIVDIIATDIMDTQALMVSKDNVGVGPQAADRVFHPEALGKKGDYDEMMVVGEYTCEWMLVYSHCWGKSVNFAA